MNALRKNPWLIAAVLALACVFSPSCERDDADSSTSTSRTTEEKSTPTTTSRGVNQVAENVEVGKRVALVIGVDHYEHLGADGQLSGAVADAERIRKALTALESPFEVAVVEDGSFAEVSAAIVGFVRSARDAECALVYFAGHGIEYFGGNFLLPRDFQIGTVSEDVAREKRIMERKAIHLQNLLDDLEATRAGVKLVILDACRNNPLQVVSAGDGSGPSRAFGNSSGGLASVSAPSGMLISYSADAGQQANDGLFTEVLCKNMQRPGLSIVEVFAATRSEVKSRSIVMAREREGAVVHEPAEYNKLNEAGVRFRFAGGLTETERQLAELKEKLAAAERKSGQDAAAVALVDPEQSAMLKQQEQELAELRRRLEEKDAQMLAAQSPPAKAQAEAEAVVAADQAKVELAAASVGVGAVPMSKTTTTTPALPLPVAGDSAHPAARGFEGTKAGEVKTIGGIEFAWCPAGTFTMGSPAGEEDRSEDENQVEVTLSKGFWMARTECTQAQWEKVMGDNPSEFQGADLPVEQVSWDDVQKWLAKMNSDQPLPEGWKWVLPSEAQWEYACRAGTKTVFAFGDSLSSEQANFNGEYPYGGAAEAKYLEKTAKVGSYGANEWGMYDMHGNVWEWCADGYAESLKGGRDPMGSEGGSYRVIRGGGWFGNAIGCRSADRNGYAPTDRSDDLGLRVALSSTASQ